MRSSRSFPPRSNYGVNAGNGSGLISSAVHSWPATTSIVGPQPGRPPGSPSVAVPGVGVHHGHRAMRGGGVRDAGCAVSRDCSGRGRVRGRGGVEASPWWWSGPAHAERWGKERIQIDDGSRRQERNVAVEMHGLAGAVQGTLRPIERRKVLCHRARLRETDGMARSPNGSGLSDAIDHDAG
jgi:hypothetical protein